MKKKSPFKNRIKGFYIAKKYGKSRFNVDEENFNFQNGKDKEEINQNPEEQGDLS